MVSMWHENRWQKCYTDLLCRHGFQLTRASIFMFWHPERDTAVMIHGDDFISSSRSHQTSSDMATTPGVEQVLEEKRTGRVSRDSNSVWSGMDQGRPRAAKLQSGITWCNASEPCAATHGQGSRSHLQHTPGGAANLHVGGWSD